MGVEPLRGVYPILAMPFGADGRIDVDVLKQEAEYLVDAGVDGVGIALATEVPMLTERERDAALEAVVSQVRGRIKVVMNTGAAGTHLAVHYSRRAEELGADAVMVLPPPPANTTPYETIAYYGEIASAIHVPIFMQDVATSPVTPGLAAQVASATQHTWYLKAETPPTPSRVTEVQALTGERVTVFGGAGGGFFVEELRRGSQGIMPGSAVPEAFVDVWRHFQRGQLDDAEVRFARYAPLLRLLGQGNGIGLHLTKEVLRVRGVFTGTDVRRPAVRPDEMAYREIGRQLELLGIAHGVGRVASSGD